MIEMIYIYIHMNVGGKFIKLLYHCSHFRSVFRKLLLS